MTPAEPWPHRLRWTDLERGVASLKLVADRDARSRIASFLDLEAVGRLRADLTVRPWLDGIEIAGRIEARVTQVCGVTLEAFDAEIADDLLVRLVPPGSPNAARREGADLAMDVDAEDPPEELAGDSVDIGAFVVEHLALALDPFPRKPGAVFEPPEPTKPRSPFAALGRLKPPQPPD